MKNEVENAKRACAIYDSFLKEQLNLKELEGLEKLFAEIVITATSLDNKYGKCQLGETLSETALERAYCAFVFRQSDSRAKRALEEIKRRLDINYQAMSEYAKEARTELCYDREI